MLMAMQRYRPLLYTENVLKILPSYRDTYLERFQKLCGLSSASAEFKYLERNISNIAMALVIFKYLLKRLIVTTT